MSNFDAWAEKRYPLASRQDSLGGFSRDMRKSALEGWEVATALNGVVIAKQAMQLDALAANNKRLREALVELMRVMPCLPSAAKQIDGMPDRYDAAIKSARAALADSKDGDL